MVSLLNTLFHPSDGQFVQFDYPAIRSFVLPSVRCPFVRSSVRLSVRPFVRPSVRLSVRPFEYMATVHAFICVIQPTVGLFLHSSRDISFKLVQSIFYT